MCSWENVPKSNQLPDPVGNFSAMNVEKRACSHKKMCKELRLRWLLCRCVVFLCLHSHTRTENALRGSARECVDFLFVFLVHFGVNSNNNRVYFYKKISAVWDSPSCQALVADFVARGTSILLNNNFYYDISVLIPCRSCLSDGWHIRHLLLLSFADLIVNQPPYKKCHMSQRIPFSMQMTLTQTHAHRTHSSHMELKEFLIIVFSRLNKNTVELFGTPELMTAINISPSHCYIP